MAVLLLAEVANGHLSDLTARALTAAAEIGQPVEVLVAGQGVGAAARSRCETQRRGQGAGSRTTRLTRTASPSHLPR